MMIVLYAGYKRVPAGNMAGLLTAAAAAAIAKPLRTSNVLLLYHHFKQSNHMYLDLSPLFSPVCEYSHVQASRLMNHAACSVESRLLNCSKSQLTYLKY